MEAKYERQAKVELRMVMKRCFGGRNQIDLSVKRPAPVLLSRLKSIHLPLETKTERRLSLHCYRLSVDELLRELSFDSLLKAWRLEMRLQVEMPLRFSMPAVENDGKSQHNVKTQIEESRLDGLSTSRILTLRSVELPSLLSSQRSKSDVLQATFPPDNALYELRCDLVALLQRQFDTPLRAFLAWDKDHVNPMQDFKLSHGEFRDGVRSAGMKGRVDEIDGLFTALDQRRRTMLTFREFFHLFESEEKPRVKSLRLLRPRLTPQAFSCFHLPTSLE